MEYRQKGEVKNEFMIARDQSTLFRMIPLVSPRTTENVCSRLPVLSR